jgi:O-antigen/teichoic acid export membrane protein
MDTFSEQGRRRAQNDRMDKNKLKTNGKIATDFESKTRTLNVNRQVIISLFLKGLMMILTLVQVPLSKNILGDAGYGAWQIVFSVTAWLGIMDIGIGTGLRNKLAESIANQDFTLAKSYITTSYLFLGFLVFVLFLPFLLIASFVDWNSILHIKVIGSTDLLHTVILLVFYTFVFFILNLINQILSAIQKNGLSAIPNIAANLLFVGLLYIFQDALKGDIYSVSFLYVGSMILSFTLFSVYFFYKNKIYTPSVKTFDKHKIKSISTLGFSFFLIQMAVVVIFQTDNLIISYLFNESDVTRYSITQKAFNSYGMLVGLVMAPLWSAYTEAYVKKDFEWIRQRIKTLNLLMIPLIAGILIFVLFFDTLKFYWLGEKGNIEVPHSLSILMGIYTIISVWNNIYAYFLNGISRLKEQLITAIIGMVANIPLCILFAKTMNMGVSGVILGTIVSLSLFSFVGPYITYSIISRKNESVN